MDDPDDENIAYLLKSYYFPSKLIYFVRCKFLTIADIAYANESIRAAVIVFNAFFEFNGGLFSMKHVLFRF